MNAQSMADSHSKINMEPVKKSLSWCHMLALIGRRIWMRCKPIFNLSLARYERYELDNRRARGPGHKSGTREGLEARQTEFQSLLKAAEKIASRFGLDPLPWVESGLREKFEGIFIQDLSRFGRLWKL